jgi:cell division septation protein DedD
MIKLILGMLVALGITVYSLSQYMTGKEPAPKPPAPTQPAPKTGQEPGAPVPQPPAAGQPTPPVTGPIAPPAGPTVPTPQPPQVEEKGAPLPTLEPKKEHGLLVGNFTRYKDAQRLLDKIQKKKLPGFIRMEGKSYKVWVGPFTTPKEAENTGKNLRTALKISPQMRDYEVPVPK